MDRIRLGIQDFEKSNREAFNIYVGTLRSRTAILVIDNFYL